MEQDSSAEAVEKNTQSNSSKHGRQSTAPSIASTALTRASNVIQIAYIPGVTNRSPPDTPGVLVPPVPPIPANLSNSSNGNVQDQHYFMPGDIRDSVWSEMTEEQRRSVSPSLSRSSVATTIYRNNAIVSPVPAQQALRGKANVVSVKSGTSTPVSTPRAAPAVPAITPNQLQKAQNIAAQHNAQHRDAERLAPSSIVARTVVAKPVNVGPSRNNPSETIHEDVQSVRTTPSIVIEAPPNSEVASLASHHRGDGDSDASDDEEPRQHTGAGGSGSGTGVKKTRESAAVTVIEDSPAIRQSPFADPETSSRSSGASTAIPLQYSPKPSHSNETINAQNGSSHRHRNSLGSDRMLENSSSQETVSGQRNMGPFSDRNEVKPS